MAKTCKYQSYAELAAAFKSGELDKEKYILMLDNDCSHLCYTGDDMTAEEANEHCRGLFIGNGQYDYEECVRALGIPCEGV